LISSPLVSILINNYNYGQFLKEAIDSALQQTYKFIEVIVVDDGSTDNSKEIITYYGRNIIAILKENDGQASAFNLGFDRSQGDIICFLDSDDRFKPNKVERIEELFRKYPQAGWVFHNLDYINALGEPILLGKEYRISGVQKIDVRNEIRKGIMRLPYAAPATSGLCFKKNILSCILPMKLNILQPDNYLKFAAFYLSFGIHTYERLAAQRIHGSNFFTFRNDVQLISDESHLKIAYYLREKFPYINHFSDRMFATSFGRIIMRKGKKAFDMLEVNQYINNYYSINKWLFHSPRIAINIMRVLISKIQRLNNKD